MTEHVYYKAGDFTDEEYDENRGIARLVIDGDLAICKLCGAAEAELIYQTCEEYKEAKERGDV